MTSDADHPVANTFGAIVRIVVLVALVVALAAFVLVNSQTIEVDFLATETEAPLIAVLAGTAVVGGVIVELLRFRSRHR